MLESLEINKGLPLPIKFFQVGDVVHLDHEHETGAANIRRIAAVVANKEAQFHVVHGDRKSVV